MPPAARGIAFVTTSLGVAFDMAYVGLLPSLVHSDRLVEGNSKLMVSRSTASTLVITGTVPIGSLLGGALAQIIGVRPMLIGAGWSAIFSFAVLIASPVYRYWDPD